MKVLSEDKALELTELLLQNDKNIKDELEQKIESVSSNNGYDDTALTEMLEIIEETLDDKADKSELHTHENKDVLDGITSDKITSWDAKATETFVNNAIANAQLGGGDTEIDLSGYATKDDLKGYAIKGHAHDEYLTEHQDLSAYALKSEIPTDYLSSIPDEYVTTEEMTEAINNAKLDGESVDLSDYVKKTDIPDTSNFVEKEDGKGLFSGSYDDLTDKPNIPEAYDDTDLDNRIKAIEDDYVKQADIPTTLPASDVYDWAKAEIKPAYTADEVGALPNTTVIPSVEGLASEEYVNNAIAEQIGGALNGTY